MYRNRKLTPALLAVLLLGTAALSACGNSNGNAGTSAGPSPAAASQAPSADPYASLPKEISGSIYDRGRWQREKALMKRTAGQSISMRIPE